MGLYLAIYADDASQRSVTKIGNTYKTDYLSHKVLYAEPGAEDAGIIDRYGHYNVRAQVNYYLDGTTRAIYKIKSKLDLTRVLLMFEWEKLHG